MTPKPGEVWLRSPLLCSCITDAQDCRRERESEMKLAHVVPPGLDNGWREVSWRFLQKNIEGYALLRLQLMNSNLPPAVGTNAATEIKWGFGTSRWQLGYQPTSGGSRGKRVNVAYWPIATLPQEFTSAMPPKADKPEPTRMTEADVAADCWRNLSSRILRIPEAF